MSLFKGYHSFVLNQLIRILLLAIVFSFLFSPFSNNKIKLPLQVCGVRDKRADNVWLAVEGVYLPVNES